MPKYLLEVNYLDDGLKGLIKEGGTRRRAAAEKAVKSVGGSIESFYYAFGAADVYVIADVPDNINAAALTLTLNASGAVACRTTVLLTTEEVDAAVKKHPKYRPPGKK